MRLPSGPDAKPRSAFVAPTPVPSARRRPGTAAADAALPRVQPAVPRRPLTPAAMPASPASAASARAVAQGVTEDLATPDTVAVSDEYLSGTAHHLASIADYDRMYAESIRDPDAFWARVATESFYWKTWPPVDAASGEQLLQANFTPSAERPVSTSFAAGATTNIAYNCLDRNVDAGRGEATALLFEPNDPAEADARAALSYAVVLKRVKQFAAALRHAGVGKGDVVTIYMPMVAELPIAMLACARIGAIHSVVFGGFSAESLAGRIRGAASTCVVTCDAVYRGKKLIELKNTVDAAVALAAEGGDDAVTVKSVLVLERVGSEAAPVTMRAGTDVWWHDAVAAAEAAGVEDHIEWVDAEHPLFILYTSGSTGRPKGIQHSTGGYMVYTATTFKYTFNYQPGDVFFCTADCGWITGKEFSCCGGWCDALWVDGGSCIFLY